MKDSEPRSRAAVKRTPGWRTRLRRRLPSADSVRHNRYVAWIGPAIHHPRLWHLNRHGVALGLAIGLFFGFLIPLAQIPVAAIFAVWFRANLLVAVVSTLVTNPFTFPPVYFFAYQIGAMLTGDSPLPHSEAAIGQVAQEASTLALSAFERLLTVGKPLMLGLAVLAVSSALVSYFLVLGVWRLVVSAEWRRRRSERRR
jgi:uncharacterized protein